MRITPPMFGAFLKCATKCHLRSSGEIGSGNEYAEWVRGQDESYQREAARRLQAAVPETERVVAPPATENLKAAKWRLAIDLLAQTPIKSMDRSLDADADATLTGETHPSPCPLPAMRGEGGRRPGEGSHIESPVSESPPHKESQGPGGPHPEQLLESCLHAVERVPSEGRGKPAQFVPIRFIYRNKLTHDDRLLLAFDALVLSETLGREVSLGNIIHGDDHPTLKVKTSALTGEVRKRLQKMAAMLSNPSPPDLVLNRHCAECEFQGRCRKIAVEKDDLSLLSGMKTEERMEYRSKGIFTVTQLSYTFRPRRRPKKLRDKREKYHHSLKALAIREKKIHIVGSPELKIEGTPVYLDVEGLPDRDFYYLIGVRIGDGESAVQHSLWADTVADEGKIWLEFLGILESVEKPVLIHYGSYETTFLKRMSERHGDLTEKSTLAKTIASTINLLAAIYGRIYFPTCSNGLKNIAGWLGFEWSVGIKSGTQTICWRHAWETSAELIAKQKLITYNCEDCWALQKITTQVSRICGGSDTADVASEVVPADAMPESDSLWPRFSSPISAFEIINKAAKWDYQRDRVYVRISKASRSAAVNRKIHHHPHRKTRVNMEIVCENSSTCPRCGKAAEFVYEGPRTLYDLRFTPQGVRRWVVRYHFRVFYCPYCRCGYGKPKEFWRQTRYGPGVVAMVVYSVIRLRTVNNAIQESLNTFFNLGLSNSIVNRLKASAAAFYEETRKKILARLVAGRLIHADETQIALKRDTAYVWVFASFHEVVFFYSENREGNLLRESLAGFKGVLVSDFYAVYDAMPCPQQKCLIHLIRDLNDAVLDQPFDQEVRTIATGFGDLLREIVETIDRRGLKHYFLKKHWHQVQQFYKRLKNTAWESESALRIKERFEKNHDKLFTFLDYDEVPWNNNNAEHAIKAFAKLRRAIVGLSTPKGIEEYLILLSVCQTCKYMGVDFLDFLRSGEKDVHAFAESQRGRRGRTQPSQPIGLPLDVIPDIGSQP